MATSYTPDFYDTIANGSERSAKIVAPLIAEAFTPITVIDVGCGRGLWAREFARLGADVTGIDGAYVAQMVIDNFIPHDLATPIPPTLGTFDLAVSLEVAEHLPESRAAGFVADLCALAPTVVFSAAIPYQTGTGHLNCQWPSYWARLFADHDYGVTDSLRRELWTDPRIEVWYRQNILIFSTTTEPLDDPEILNIVHPEMHAWGRR